MVTPRYVGGIAVTTATTQVPGHRRHDALVPPRPGPPHSRVVPSARWRMPQPPGGWPGHIPVHLPACLGARRSRPTARPAAPVGFRRGPGPLVYVRTRAHGLAPSFAARTHEAPSVAAGRGGPGRESALPVMKDTELEKL